MQLQFQQQKVWFFKIDNTIFVEYMHKASKSMNSHLLMDVNSQYYVARFCLCFYQEGNFER